MSFKIELGSKVRCKITTYEGVVYARHEYLYGCRRYSLQSRELKDGKPVEPYTIDEDAAEILVQAEPHKVKDTGGPQAEPGRRSEPSVRKDPVR